MPEMTCEVFEIRLNAMLDERADFYSDSRFVDHARNCTECARTLKAFSSIEAVVVQPPTAKFGGSVRVWAALATAASLLALLFVFARKPDAATMTQATPNSTIPVPPSAAGREVPIQRPSTGSVHWMSLVHPISAMISMNEIPMEHATPALRRLEPVASPIRPLANSMSSTINVLRKTIPLGREKQPVQVLAPPQTSLVSNATVIVT